MDGKRDTIQTRLIAMFSTARAVSKNIFETAVVVVAVVVLFPFLVLVAVTAALPDDSEWRDY